MPVGHHVRGLPSDDEDGDVLFANEVDVWEWALEMASIIDPSEDGEPDMRWHASE